MPPQELLTRAGPNQRAGLNEPPVSGPRDHHREAQRRADRQRRPVLDALRREHRRQDHQHEHEGPDRLDHRAGGVAREQRADRGGAVVGGAALVEQQRLGQQGAEDAARELGEDVDDGVDRVDPPDHRRRQGHRRVEVPAADDAEHHDQPEEEESVHQADDREVGAELSLVAGGDEQHHDAGDEEDQQESADQLGDVGGESSFRHWEETSSVGLRAAVYPCRTPDASRWRCLCFSRPLCRFLFGPQMLSHQRPDRGAATAARVERAARRERPCMPTGSARARGASSGSRSAGPGGRGCAAPAGPA